MKIKLGVMFGGASVEHEISILSAMQAMEQLNPEKYEILPIYVGKDKKMYHDPCLRDIHEFKDLKKLMEKLSPVLLFARDQKYWIRSISRFFTREKEVDMILPIMHGTYGEDGSVQGYLRMLGIPYCGSEVLGAAIGQDKIKMKEILQAHQIPVCPWFSVDVYTYRTSTMLEKAEALGYPLILKPSNLGSSVGIHVVQNEEELMEGLQDAFLYDERIIIEKAIPTLREFNCSVMGNLEMANTSCVEEVLKEDTILSYHDKYEGGAKSKGMASTKRILPAPLDDAQRKEIETLALQSFQALVAEGVVRIDFLMDTTTNKIYVNEINTIPGSLSFYLWEPLGISFSQLLDYVVELGLKRQRRQANMIYSYSTNILSSYKKGCKLMK